MNLKKKLCLGLAATLLTTVVSACAMDSPKEPNETGSEDNGSPSSPALEESRYIDYKGTISAVTKEDPVQITVDAEDSNSEFEQIAFNLRQETPILSDVSQDFIEISKIKEGDSVEVFYAKTSPMTKSIPPITKPEAIILRESEDNENKLAVTLNTFDENLISEDNAIELKINEDTLIVDSDGNELAVDDIIGREVIAFYGPAMTLSIPAQSEAKKIILIGYSKP